MALPVEVYLDITTPQGRLVKDLNTPDSLDLGIFYQGSQISFRIFPVTRISQTSAPFFAKVDITSLTFQLVAGPRAGAEAILCAQYTWLKQTTPDTAGKSGYFYADFDLNTTLMNTAVGTNDSISTYLEFRIGDSGNIRPVAQTNLTVVATVKDPTSAASTPTPAAAYMTRDECLEAFVLWNNSARAANAGRTVILVSPDGASTRELGVGNDKAAVDNLT